MRQRLISGPLGQLDNLIGVALSMFWQNYCTATSVAALDEADASSRFVPTRFPVYCLCASDGARVSQRSGAWCVDQRAEVYPIH
jgi:hypothetical protein